MFTAPYSSVRYHADDGTPQPISTIQELLDHYRSLYEAQHGIPKESQKRDPFDHQSYGSITTQMKDKFVSYQNPSIRYFENHKIWNPEPLAEELFTDDYKQSFTGITSVREHVSDEGFINYWHVPRVQGENPIPPILHHTTAPLNSHLYILGGIINRLSDPTIDLSQYVEINCDLDLPFPLDSAFLHNPAMIPNNSLFKLSAETNHLSKPEILGDIPPPLMCMSSSEITQRYIFYYGGFQFNDKIEFNEITKKFIITRNIILNNNGYILDTFTNKFQKFELMAHPTITSKHPITVPRFGHSSSSINLSNKRINNVLTSVATCFIMGGYKMNEKNQFEIISDLWKVEFSTVYHGKNDYIKFANTILATPIHRAIDDNFLPNPRAFHVAEIVDSTHVFSKLKNNDHFKIHSPNPNKVGILNRSYSPDSIGGRSHKSISTDSDHYLDLKLIIHGGTDGEKIHGDVWWFDFDQEIWSKVDTFFPEYDDNLNFININNKSGIGNLNEVQVKKVAHKSIIIDRYLILFGGEIPINFNFKENLNEINDISKLYLMKNKNSTNDNHNKLFGLNLSTQTWVLIKCYHSFDPAINEESKTETMSEIGATVTSCNSKIFLIGGRMIQGKKNNTNSRLKNFENVPLINNSISIFEFPLGSATNLSSRRI